MLLLEASVADHEIDRCTLRNFVYFFGTSSIGAQTGNTCIDQQ